MLKLFFLFAVSLVGCSEVIEDRSGIEWTYKPTVNYSCNFVGCCGSALEPCSPEYWKYLNPNTFERCQQNQQSPINIELNDSFIPLEYPIVLENILCNGTIVLRNNTWEIDFLEPKCAVKTFQNTTWYLNNMHIHNAEHTIDGEYMPVEVHYVHKDSTEENVMVISLFVIGTSTFFYHPLLSLFEENNKDTVLQNIPPYTLMTRDPSYWHYRGSLTTPPCQTSNHSIVQWFVMKDMVEVNHKQIFFFTEYLKKISKSYRGRVNRPIQDILQDTLIFSYK